MKHQQTNLADDHYTERREYGSIRPGDVMTHRYNTIVVIGTPTPRFGDWDEGRLCYKTGAIGEFTVVSPKLWGAVGNPRSLVAIDRYIERAQDSEESRVMLEIAGEALDAGEKIEGVPLEQVVDVQKVRQDINALLN